MFSDIYNSLFPTQSTTYEVEKDFEKFTEFSSPRSQISSRSNKTVKDLINEGFEDYVNRIKEVKNKTIYFKEYKIFKSHHYTKRTSVSRFYVQNHNNNNNSENIYVSPEKIYTIIPQEYFSSDFKIPREILENKQPEVIYGEVIKYDKNIFFS